MPAELQYRPEGGYVLMRVWGLLNVRTGAEMLGELRALLSEHDCHRVLVDYSEAELEESVTGMYQFVNRMDAHIPRSLVMACVVHRDTEDHLFFETVARNQGWRYRLFHDRGEAEAWLLAG